jgi:chaperonin GroEL
MTPTNTHWQTPKVTSQPYVARGFQLGVNQLVRAIAPTLGPLPRTVVIEPIDRYKRPEVLDDGATIARRLTMLSDRNQDVGAMYLRETLCKVEELAGDGTATTAILFQSIYNEGLRYITSGGSSMILRRYLEQGAKFICTALDSMTVPLDGKQRLIGLANAVCHDPPLANAIGEIFDVIGEYNRLDIHAGNGRTIEQKYVEGNYWEGGIIHRSLAADLSGKIIKSDAFILITDMNIQEPFQIIPLLELAAQHAIKHVFLIVSDMSEKVISLLATPATRKHIHVAVIKSYALTGAVSRDEMQDLALLTGGRALLEKAGYSLRSVQLQDLGHARRAWADKDFFRYCGRER